MITLVEALRFRSLKDVRQPLGRFEVLAGPHASGKTAFLDAIETLGRLVSTGVEGALARREFADLVWMREGSGFELALEARIPEERRARLANPEYDTVRYEVALGLPAGTGEPAILEEKVLLRAPAPADQPAQPALFPAPPESLLTSKRARAAKTVIHKNPAGNDNFYDESGKGWDHAFRLGNRRSALGNLPDEETKFPVSTWFRNLLAAGVRRLEAETPIPAAPGPWFDAWRARIREAVPALEDILPAGGGQVLRYRGGFEAPAEVAPGGLRRLLALTLAVSAPGSTGVWLADNPESGLDACAVKALLETFASVRNAQVLMASVSPALPGQLRFSTTPEGATVITRQDQLQ